MYSEHDAVAVVLFLAETRPLFACVTQPGGSVLVATSWCHLSSQMSDLRETTQCPSIDSHLAQLNHSSEFRLRIGCNLARLFSDMN